MSPQEAVLLRQREGLRSLIAAAREGPLIPFNQVLVVLDQNLVQSLLASATPYERSVGERFRVRVTSARVQFEDGFALVRLDGRASLANRPEEDAFVDVNIYGGLDIVELDPQSGVLRGRVRIMGFETKRLTLFGLEAPGRRLLKNLSDAKIEEFNVLGSNLEIPVQLDQEVTIPEVGPEGEIHIPAAVVPLRVAVQDVKAFRGKLWVSIGVDIVPEGEKREAPEADGPTAEKDS